MTFVKGINENKLFHRASHFPTWGGDKTSARTDLHFCTAPRPTLPLSIHPSLHHPPQISLFPTTITLPLPPPPQYHHPSIHPIPSHHLIASSRLASPLHPPPLVSPPTRRLFLRRRRRHSHLKQLNYNLGSQDLLHILIH
uniref:Uncharacterized protein n=1 Tax=Oryza glumipatula TaxID=40148 RepID=A0A0E0AAB0_9ORYZ